MYIKQIIIEGYKSYGQRTVIGPFDPSLNVVVGRNGSGKSNFFSAIEFVISDEFAKFSVEQRQSFFHEASQRGNITASVEIIFENSDRRFAIDKNEVNLKRTVGLKFDQYILNKKVVSRNEMISLLEAAGLSRSNPYYIVKQGKINQLAMTSESRLKLLQEIAGTDVFEEKRTESLKLLKESEKKCNNIQELLITIDQRLEVLQEEMEELKEYQKWEKQQRCMEHIIHEREKIKNKEKLEGYEAEYKVLNKDHSKLSSKYEELKKKIKDATKECKRAKKNVTIAEEEKTNLRLEQEEVLKEETKLKLTIHDLEKDVENEIGNKNKIEKELENLNILIEEKSALLREIELKYEEKLHEEEGVIRSLDSKEQKRKELYNKQGRGVQFQTKEERDLWIKNELEQLHGQIEEKQIYINNLERDVHNDNSRCIKLEQDIESRKIEMQRQTERIVELHKQLGTLRKERDEKICLRGDLHKEDRKIQDDLDSMKEELMEVNQSLNSLFGKSIFNGINGVNRVLDTFRRDPDMSREVDKYYGLVIENFDCDPGLYTAVEVTAGNRLFHHVVETNHFANKIIQEFNRQKSPGVVTFMPIDCLNVYNSPYVNSKDAKPMIEHLRYDDDLSKAMKHLFARTLVCRDLKIATTYARDYKLDCVTLDGDQAGSAGWMKGGHINRTKSPMELQKRRSKIMDEIDMKNDALNLSRQKIHETNESINHLISEIQKVEMKITRAKDNIQTARNDLSSKEDELNSIIEFKKSKERSLIDHKSHLDTMNATKVNLENELTQELTDTLSAADQQEIDELNDSIAELSKQLKITYKERAQLEMEKNKLENLLTKNLKRIREKKQQDLQEILIGNKKQFLEESTDRLLRLQEKITEIKTDLEVQDQKIVDAVHEQNVSLEKVEKLKEEEKEMAKEVEKSQKELGKIKNKIHIINENLHDAVQKPIEHAVIPNNELYAKFSKLQTKELFTFLGKVKNHLKEFQNVNKKALDQYDVFTLQRKKLNERKDELDRAYDKIKILFDTLQQRKCEHVEFTFKQVSKYFNEIFHKLVPMGQGRLIMLSNQESSDRSTRESASSRSSALVDSFIGIDVEVSFTGRDNSTRIMDQLSGGQKSLVALALIFAIQKCDPAPFYLFDEIDQALDPEHRKAVSDMIHELSSNAQFIMTTFRSELLEHANLIFGVSFKNTLSSVNSITYEEAADFIQHDEAER